jgi:hypothetical protein
VKRRDHNPTLSEITVCSQCLRACCWQLVFRCDKADRGVATKMHIATAQKLGLEHPDFWRRGWHEMGEARRGSA